MIDKWIEIGNISKNNILYQLRKEATYLFYSMPIANSCKYGIYPSDTQVVFFTKTCGCCRFVWNKMLDKKLQAYKKKERIQRIIPAKYKEEFPFLK